MENSFFILFDGDCNLCSRWVQFINKHSKNISFATLRSASGEALLLKNGYLPGEINSIVFFASNKVYFRSDAVLQIVRYLDGLWPMFYALIIVPKFIRDVIYIAIAKHRYNWFGNDNECLLSKN